MNICIFCHDLKMSGANMSLYDWLKDSGDSKNNYIVVLPRNNRETKNKFEKIGIKVLTGFYKPVHKNLYKTRGYKSIKLIASKIYAALFNNLSYYFLYRKLKKMNLDIIHSNSFATVSGVKVAIKLKIPHVWHIREFMEEDHQIQHLFKNSIKKFCQYSSAIFISDIIEEKYIKNYQFKNYKVIYNRIEYDKLYKKDRRFMEDGFCNIILVGTLSKNKGQMDAIKAIQKLNSLKYRCKLFICGTGPNEKELKKYVSTSKISNIMFMGQVSTVTELRKNMDIALMCSEKEALGRVTIEAQYYENLIIGANCGCTPFIIEDNRTGLLYEKGLNNLSDKIIYCMEHKEKYLPIIREAKKRALNTFNVNIIQKIENFYLEII